MDSQPDLWTYVLLQHLPTVSERFQAIISIAPSYSTKKQKEAVHMFASSLRELLVKSFTDEDVITLKYIKLKLTEHLKVYVLKVSKAKGNKQQKVKIWLAGNFSKLMFLLKKSSNPCPFDQDEKNFYFGQQSLDRKMALSKDIDEEHEKEVAEQRTVSQNLADNKQTEREFIDELSDNELSFLESTRCDHETSVNVSQNRSGMVRSTKPVAEVGT